MAGIIFGAVVVIVVATILACMKIASDCDREEDKKDG